MDAVERRLQRIAEAAIELQSVAAELLPDQNWKAMRDLGNGLRHECDGISPNAIRQTVHDDLPSLLKGRRRAIAILDVQKRRLRAWRRSLGRMATSLQPFLASPRRLESGPELRAYVLAGPGRWMGQLRNSKPHASRGNESGALVEILTLMISKWTNSGRSRPEPLLRDEFRNAPWMGPCPTGSDRNLKNP